MMDLDSLHIIGEDSTGADLVYYVEGFPGPGRSGQIWLSHILVGEHNAGTSQVDALKITDLTGQRERKTIDFSGVPADTDTVTLDDVFSVSSQMRDIDGNLRTASTRIFEFDNDGSITAGRVAVPIGATAEACAYNLWEAIIAEASAYRILVDAYVQGATVHVTHSLGGNIGGATFAAESSAAISIGADTSGATGALIHTNELRTDTTQIDFQRWFRDGLRIDLKKGSGAGQLYEIDLMHVFSSQGPRGSAQGLMGAYR